MLRTRLPIAIPDTLPADRGGDARAYEAALSGHDAEQAAIAQYVAGGITRSELLAVMRERFDAVLTFADVLARGEETRPEALS